MSTKILENFKTVLLIIGWMSLLDVMIFLNQRVDIYEVGISLGQSEVPPKILDFLRALHRIGRIGRLF